MSQLLLWRPLASALVAEGPTKWEASVSEDRKGNCCDIQTPRLSCQVGNYFAIYVLTWMRHVPQRAVRGRWACQVWNFPAIYVLTWMGKPALC